MSTKAVERPGETFKEELVQQQLQKIFLCPAFTVSDILRRFLTYIIQETFAGRSNTIKEYTIAVNVLNKPISFKPQHDAIVRIHAGRLRRALNYYYREQGAQDSIEISVPKGSYVPVFSLLEQDESRKEILPAIEPQLQLMESIAVVVIPFKTFETDIARVSFVDSLGQQLSAELGKFPDFSVISYYATQQFTAKSKEFGEMANHFGSQYLITGNVQFETRRMRVSVQLTDTYTGTQIWSELYHRNYTSSNLFEVADNIVSLVIGNLADFNGVIVQQMTRGMTKNKQGKTCFTLLSAYHDFYANFSEPGFKKAFHLMELTIQEDPSNEMAWAFMGELSLLAFLFNYTTRENPLIQGLRCARMSLNINPLSQHGLITLALANIFLNNKPACLEALENAVALNTNAAGITGIAGCLMFGIGEYNRGISLINKSIERNRSYPVFFNLFIGLYHFKQKDYDQAYLMAEKIGIPDLGLNVLLRVSILSQMGKKQEATTLLKTLKGSSVNKSWISKEYISRFLHDKDLVDNLYRGLKTAEMPLLTVA